MLRLLDLFSGIGGFSLAASWTGVIETAAFCEIDPYCQNVLRKHWPEVPIFDDIRTLTTDTIGPIDILTGGFPCQPFSVAGKQRGTEDDRHLWPEMARVIAESRPRWIVGENTPGIINLALDDCLFDLESLGYEAWTVVLPACAVEALHRRDRVWIVAHANSERKPQQKRTIENIGRRSCDLCETMADTDSQRVPHNGPGETSCSAGTVQNETQEWQRVRPHAWKCDDTYRRPWTTEPNVGRMVNGVPGRVDRLRALGNAVVPQVAYEILNIIVKLEGEELAS